MNACQLLFLLEAERLQNPPFQSHVSKCSKSGERSKTTKRKKKKRASKQKEIHLNITAGFSSSAWAKRIHPDTAPFCPTSTPSIVHETHVSLNARICAFLQAEGFPHTVWSPSACWHIWEMNGLLVLAELTVM